ncbi:HsdM family class I SAM-dependent methyltransferase [Finegoldia magna]|uniref:HsdM family class I SAM-dependent methyltransferase n=1 Tax=Finegoldia magna TaxID=1260 RepID=UPI001ED77E4D|nr:N-6 DNA methylase [Finegoldia magna]MBS5359961.1 N-6 DNA methylase [Finegoldia magna]MDU5960708.1 N-6 DNA methylase [Finegoldia magna]
MNNKEKSTDLWVYDLLKEANISLDPQGSSIKEINEALKTASKRGTGRVGFPEYVGVVKDFIIVIEDKSSLSMHVKRTERDLLSEDIASICDYAVNGALFYGKHLIKNTSYTKVIAIGVSGNEKKHKINPLFINERLEYDELPEIETFISFSEDNIHEYYTKEILKENTSFEKETSEILKDAASLHEDLRNYGSIQDKDKPLIVSGILLALREIEHGSFSIDSLTGDANYTDGEKIYDAIKKNLKRANVSPEVKRDKLLNQFSVIKDTTKINQKDITLDKTPNRHYTEFLYRTIFQSIKYHQSGEDYLGRFYGEFMSYSGGDGQTLGIILTPRHITELFCDLLDLKPTDKVIDPCCGTAGFLIASMHNMLQKTDDDFEKNNIRKNQLFGIEDQPYMFTIATTNMILRGDGKSNLENKDFLKQNPAKLQLKSCTVGMMNPPYSQGSKDNPNLYEISFTEHLLESVVEGARVAVIVPQSTMTGKTKYEKETKANILKHHTLEGVITLNKNTFYGVGTNPCIAVFTAGIPHHKDKLCKFINFEDDGFEVAKHIGLIETPSAKDKKQHLLDVWFDRIDAETKFCVETTIESDDEWLHSFYYFNDEIPTDEDFRNTIADYITFEVNMITHGRGYLFGIDDEKEDYSDEIMVADEGEDYETE